MRHLFGHGYDNFVTQHRSDKSNADAGVATACLYECVARCNFAMAFGSANHLQRSTIFDATCWIEKLTLKPNVDVQMRKKPSRSNEWSLSDGVENRVAMHSFIFCIFYFEASSAKF